MNQTAKRILSVLLSLTLALGALAVPAFAVAYAPGDVDGDENVTTKDARLALRAALELEQLSEEAIPAADVDGSGEVGTDDARVILRAALRLQRLPKGNARPGQPALINYMVECYDKVHDDAYYLKYLYQRYNVKAYMVYSNENDYDFTLSYAEDAEDFHFRCILEFDRFFRKYVATLSVYNDGADKLCYRTFDVDPTLLNPGLYNVCFRQTDGSGSVPLTDGMLQAMATAFCVELYWMLEDMRDAGFYLSKEKMRLDRLPTVVF